MEQIFNMTYFYTNTQNVTSIEFNQQQQVYNEIMDAAAEWTYSSRSSAASLLEDLYSSRKKATVRQIK